MTLIKCPECNKEISSKSHACIYCGFPIADNDNSENLYSFELINFVKGNKSQAGILNLLRIFFPNYNVISIMKSMPIILSTGLQESNANWLKNKFENLNATVSIKIDKNCNEPNKQLNALIEKESNNFDIICCPRCGSTSITTGQRGFKITTGFLGSNKTVNRCAKCGFAWAPK